MRKYLGKQLKTERDRKGYGESTVVEKGEKKKNRVKPLLYSKILRM